MDIAALSVAMSSASVMQQANVSMMRKTMDMQETQMNSLLDIMKSTPTAPPSFGHKLDVRV